MKPTEHNTGTTKNDIEIESITVPRDDMERILEIVREMSSLLRSEIREKHNLLLMGAGFEDLDTAAGMLLSALHPGDAGLVISNQDTRMAVKKAYSHLEAVLPNTIDQSPAQAACLQLEAALFSVLNLYYENGQAQAQLEQAMSAANFGAELASGLLDAGEDALDDCYLNPGGQKLTMERLEMAKSVLTSLLPKYDPDGTVQKDEKEARHDAH